MNNTSHRGNGLADTPEEEVLLLLVGLGVLGTVLASASIWWLKGATWLIEHGFLVAATAHPVVAIPGAGGAGVDMPRLVILAAVILAVLVLTASSASSAIARRREKAG